MTVDLERLRMLVDAGNEYLAEGNIDKLRLCLALLSSVADDMRNSLEERA